MFKPSITFLKAYVLVSAIVYIVVNGLIGSGAVKIGYGDNKTVSDKYYTYITPAGWAFAIWSFIFILQGAWAIYQVLPFRNYDKIPLIEAFGLWLPITFNLQTAWPILFCYEQILVCFFIIFLGWSTLLVAYWRVHTVNEENIERMAALSAGGTRDGVRYIPSLSERFWSFFECLTSRVAAAINLGWVTVATFANLASVFVYYDKPLSEGSSILLLVVVAVLALAIASYKKDLFVLLPVIWGVSAIISADHSRNINISSYSVVAVHTFAVVVLLVYQVVRRTQRASLDGQRLYTAV